MRCLIIFIFFSFNCYGKEYIGCEEKLRPVYDEHKTLIKQTENRTLISVTPSKSSLPPRFTGFYGMMLLRFNINDDGKASNIEAIKGCFGERMYLRVARNTLRQYVFVKAKKNTFYPGALIISLKE